MQPNRGTNDPRVTAHNREAWNKQVPWGSNLWTIPVTPEAIERARQGDWSVILTAQKPVPTNWFPPLLGARVLCLASGGGQQGPILAAAGAEVTVFDNSDMQLGQDQMVAERDGLDIRTVRGDMTRDLGRFGDGSFDLIFHPVSNVYIADILPVWQEAFRMLRPGGILLSGMGNGLIFLFDDAAYAEGRLEIIHSLPYSDAETLSDSEIQRKLEAGDMLFFGHTLEDQIGGQIAAGFVITGFYEDRDAGDDPLSRHVATYCATRALKPSEAPLEI